MLGAAIPFLNMEIKEFEKAIHSIFERKGEDVVAMNIRALQAGYDVAVTAKQTK